jgi:hypothetical protein
VIVSLVSHGLSPSGTKHGHDSYLGYLGETRSVSLKFGERKRIRREENQKEKLV